MPKTEGPSVVLIFLGVELHGHAENGDTVTQGKLAAPEERSGSGRSPGMLQKGAAILSGPAATYCVVKPERSFLQRMIDLSMHHGERNALHD